MDCSNASYFDVYSYFDSLPTFDIFYPRSKLFRNVSKTSYSIDRVFELVNEFKIPKGVFLRFEAIK